MSNFWLQNYHIQECNSKNYHPWKQIECKVFCRLLYKAERLSSLNSLNSFSTVCYQQHHLHFTGGEMRAQQVQPLAQGHTASSSRSCTWTWSACRTVLRANSCPGSRRGWQVTAVILLLLCEFRAALPPPPLHGEGHWADQRGPGWPEQVWGQWVPGLALVWSRAQQVQMTVNIMFSNWWGTIRQGHYFLPDPLAIW